MRSTGLFANAFSRSMMPERTLSSPTSMNGGMAISGKLLTACISRRSRSL